MITVYYLMKNNRISDDTVNRLCDVLPAEEREEISRLRNDEVRTDTAIGRLLLRAILYKDHGILPQNTVLIKEQNGKPYLRDHGNVHFSISHTQGCVACAVGSVPVGLDVESVSDSIRNRVVQRMFTENERAYVFADESEASVERFCRIWTMKESFVKLTGEGMSRRFNDFDVMDGSNTNGAEFTVFAVDDTAACVCTTKQVQVAINRIDLSEIEINLK